MPLPVAFGGLLSALLRGALPLASAGVAAALLRTPGGAPKKVPLPEGCKLTSDWKIVETAETPYTDCFCITVPLSTVGSTFNSRPLSPIHMLNTSKAEARISHLLAASLFTSPLMESEFRITQPLQQRSTPFVTSWAALNSQSNNKYQDEENGTSELPKDGTTRHESFEEFEMALFSRALDASGFQDGDDISGFRCEQPCDSKAGFGVMFRNGGSSMHTRSWFGARLLMPCSMLGTEIGQQGAIDIDPLANTMVALYFGSGVAIEKTPRSSESASGLAKLALKSSVEPHKLYSRLLLASAVRKLCGPT